MLIKLLKSLFVDCLVCNDEEIYKYDLCKNCFQKLNFRTYEPNSFIVPLQYNEIIKPLILNFKYNGQTSLAFLFAEIILDFIPEPLNSPVFVPIPTSRYKLFQRTYNPAVELAKALAKKTQGKMEPFVLCKNKTTTQRDKSMNERFANASLMQIKSFDCIMQKNVYIVDDLISSGATMEVAKNLIAPYAKKINEIAIAKT